jgi:N,N'-diacetyllegionaminate synthase
MHMKKIEIIAEIGWNHMGDSSLAKEMIEAAKTSGADIVKFQYWNPTYLKDGPWDKDGRREIYNKAALNEEKVLELKELSENASCKFLISVFGTIGAKTISELGIKNIKIPSHETTNKKLIEYCSTHFDFIYFSAGASKSKDVSDACSILKNGNAEFNLMHCVSSYPVSDDNANLNRINWLKTLHDYVGYSDHTQSTLIPALAVINGATVVEKHFTIDKDLPGRDNKFALDHNEFAIMSKNIYDASKSIIDRGIEFQDIERDTVENYRGRWEPQDYEN